jgi:hypothetical protein
LDNYRRLPCRSQLVSGRRPSPVLPRPFPLPAEARGLVMQNDPTRQPFLAQSNLKPPLVGPLPRSILFPTLSAAHRGARVDRNQHLCAFLTWEDYFWHGVPQTSGETLNQAPDQPIATILGLFKKFLTRIGTLATMIATRSPPRVSLISTGQSAPTSGPFTAKSKSEFVSPQP